MLSDIVLINEIIEEIVNSYKNNVVIKHITTGNVKIKSSRKHLLGVLSNLIENAIKYNDQSPEITIESRTAGRELIITVADNGPGIPDEYKQKIFDEFFRIPTGNVHNVKDYYLVSKEIWDGEIKKTDTLINTTSHILFKKAEDTLKMTVMTGKESEKKLRTQFDFGRFSLENTYESLLTDDYSMRTYGRLTAIEPNKPFYAFAYILPYEKDNGKYYCAVEGSGKDIEKWGETFGIKHYILFEMCFFDNSKESSKTESFTIITN